MAGLLTRDTVGGCRSGSTTRSGGILLLVPLLILYFHGPRSDREPDNRIGGRFWIRYKARLDLLWLLAIPAGVWLGWRLHGALDQRQIYRVCYGLLVVTAAKLLWDGVSGYLA